jgi:hypothetical protein
MYGLREDVYQSFMSGSIPNTAVPGLHLTMQYLFLEHANQPSSFPPKSHRLSLQERSANRKFRIRTIDIFHVTRLKTLGGITRLLPSLCVPGLHHPNGREVASRWSTTDRRDLIRKTKIIAFALGALGNSTDVDYPNPWNSCGDGYQTTAGSSSRSGSTLNAYE